MLPVVNDLAIDFAQLSYANLPPIDDEILSSTSSRSMQGSRGFDPVRQLRNNRCFAPQDDRGMPISDPFIGGIPLPSNSIAAKLGGFPVQHESVRLRLHAVRSTTLNPLEL
jgi:hypothetical protein